jgi:hypothetical protein
MNPETRDRPSDSPLTTDLFDSSRRIAPSALPTVRRKSPARTWRRFVPFALGGVLVAGALALGIALAAHPKSTASGSANVITDTVVRLHGSDIGGDCWKGHTDSDSARLGVAMEVGIDGKIRYATASGATPELRSCVETLVKSWEFLTQERAQTMALQIDVDRR